MRDQPPARSLDAIAALVRATLELAAAGGPLMRRVIPDDATYRVWDHYPASDAVDAGRGTRWFYHAHAPKPEWPAEHGHFHLFFDRRHFSRRRAIAKPPKPKRSTSRLVHVIALSIDQRGLPIQVFTVNRWATDEWLYACGEIVDRLPAFQLETEGDALVDRWLAAAVGAFAPEIHQALAERDRAIMGRNADFFESREHEILSSVEIDLDRLAN